jgi:rubredoxin
MYNHRFLSNNINGGGPMEPMLCPNCKTNRTRFNIIEQTPKAVKINPQTGAIEQEYTDGHLDPFHMPYRGPSYRVQCAACGLIENPEMFIKRAQHQM